MSYRRGKSYRSWAEHLHAEGKLRERCGRCGYSAVLHHRGYCIEWEPHRDPQWSYTHVDYDGPGDPRHGVAKTKEAAIAAVDERIEEGFDG